jgi:hypothetical protein
MPLARDREWREFFPGWSISSPVIWMMTQFTIAVLYSYAAWRAISELLA